MKRIITFGTYDLFHYGHLKILQRAKLMGDYLIVGISTDQLNLDKKNKKPVTSEYQRMEIISALSCVDEVFFEESLEKKLEYIKKYEAEVLVMGDDWSGRFDELKQYCEVQYLERTPMISTSQIIELIQVK